ncbi:hypothetical protein SAY86_022953 [Trapa natans]|uniref:SAND domain-containing protein n=1 Tax=Trapa natans TaxID=22666 RepID=A0AAN7M6H9_TRANT|nr:hypothetical protein SAY86_022953 [Trapa natans]
MQQLAEGGVAIDPASRCLPFQRLPQQISPAAARCSLGSSRCVLFALPNAALAILLTCSTLASDQGAIFFSVHLRFFTAEGTGGAAMANGKEGEAGPTVLFSDEELREVSGFRRGGDYVEVTCGCTSHRYGDAVGRLRVFLTGDLEITCECTPGCNEDKLTPAAFEKHSGRETARRWKNNVWVIVDGKKVPLAKTVLLKYYGKTLNGSQRSHMKVFHRDEFIRCSRCNKERRFRLRTKEECRLYHDALGDINWKCADLSYDNIKCDEEEERASRKVYRGCSRSPMCKGCTSCVCFGCDFCRFTDCSCQTCMDFTRNAKA